MFCEKCGKPIKESDAFCENCGAPVAQQSTPEQSTMHPADVPAGSEQQVQNEQSAGQNGPYNPGFYSAQPQQVPEKPKKPFPTKIVAICAAAAAVIIAAVIIFFCVVLPSLNKVNVEDYIKVTFDDTALYNGYASANVSIDYEKIEAERLPDDDSDDYMDDIADGNMDFDKMLDYLTDDSASVTSVISYCNVNAYIKNAETESTTGEESEYASTSSYYSYISRIGNDDTIVVEIKWDDSEDAQEAISEYEKDLGFSFDKTDKTVELKVSDILKEQNLTLEEVTLVDVIPYVFDNDCIYSMGIKDGEYGFQIKDFEYESGDCTVEYSAEDGNVKVCDSSGSTLETFYIYYDKNPGYLSIGDTVTFSTDEEICGESGVVIVAGSDEYTIEENAVLKQDEVKEYSDKFETAIKELADEYYSYYYDVDSDGDGYTYEYYYIEPKDADSEDVYVLVVLKGKYHGWTKDYDSFYSGFSFKNPYVSGDELHYTLSRSAADEKKDDYKEDEPLLNTDDYNVTKIS